MTPRRLLVPLLATSALVLAACGSSDEAASTTTTTVEAASAEPADTEPAVTEPAPSDTEPAPVETALAETDTEPTPAETDPAPVDTEPAPAPTTAAPNDGADGSCLIGDWVITQDEMNAYFDALTAGFGDGAGQVEFDVVGQTLLTFTASDYVYSADFDLTVAVAGTTGTGVSTGTVSGTWEAADGRIVTVLGENVLNVTVTVAGQTLDGSDMAGGFLTSSPINEAPFDCAGPTLGFQADATGAVRHDVTLTRA